MYDIRRSMFGASLVELVLWLFVVEIFLIIVGVVFVVKTFVSYYTHKSLWIALAICVCCCLAAALLYKFMQFDGSPVLACIGVAVLLITCLVVNLKNRDTLMREHVNLIDEVLHSPWFGSENTPLELEDEQLVA